jgi:hypothetical protein
LVRPADANNPALSKVSIHVYTQFSSRLNIEEHVPSSTLSDSQFLEFRSTIEINPTNDNIFVELKPTYTGSVGFSPPIPITVNRTVAARTVTSAGCVTDALVNGATASPIRGQQVICEVRGSNLDDRITLDNMCDFEPLTSVVQPYVDPSESSTLKTFHCVQKSDSGYTEYPGGQLDVTFRVLDQVTYQPIPESAVLFTKREQPR